MTIPSYFMKSKVLQTIQNLSSTRGEQIYLVGGAVRDLLLGRVTGESTPQVPRKYPASTPQVKAVLSAALTGAATREELQSAARVKDREHFRKQYLKPLLIAGLLEMSIPDKPRSSKQRYRLTQAGIEYLKKMEEKR